MCVCVSIYSIIKCRVSLSPAKPASSKAGRPLKAGETRVRLAKGLTVKG